MLLVCDECKAEFSLAPDDILSARFDYKGESYIVRYFACPKCNRAYIFLFLKLEDLPTMLAKNNIYVQYQTALQCKNVALAKRLFRRYKSLKSLLEDKMKKELAKFPNGFMYSKATETIYYRENNTDEKENVK